MNDATLPVRIAYVVECEACLGPSVPFHRVIEAVEEARLWADSSPDGRHLCDACRQAAGRIQPATNRNGKHSESVRTP